MTTYPAHAQKEESTTSFVSRNRKSYESSLHKNAWMVSAPPAPPAKPDAKKIALNTTERIALSLLLMRQVRECRESAKALRHPIGCQTVQSAKREYSLSREHALTRAWMARAILRRLFPKPRKSKPAKAA